jgi:hypothetical protein
VGRLAARGCLRERARIGARFGKPPRARAAQREDRADEHRRPPRPEPEPVKEVDSTFHEFASDWYATKELEVEPNTANHYRNELTNHLLPFFKHHHLSQITVAEVDRYCQHKVREAAEITASAESGKPMVISYVDRLGRSYRRRARPLSARSINMHIDLLAQILAVAVDHGHLPSNPAVGKRRRMKV